MSKLKIELNSQGIRDLLHDENILSVCGDCAESTVQAAGEGFSVEQRSYPERGGFVVKADSVKAYYKNLKENTLLKALGK